MSVIKATFGKVITAVSKTAPYKYFVRHVLPKMQWRKKRYSKSYMNFKYLQLVQELNVHFKDVRYAPGVVISTRDSSRVSGLVVPTDLDHTALISCWDEKESDFKIVQALADGVVETYLQDLLVDCEGFVAHVGAKWGYDYRLHMVEIARSFIGKPYDSEFQFGVEALYCSEIVYLADKEKIVKYDTSDLAGIGTKYISPKGITEGVGMLKLFDSEIEL